MQARYKLTRFATLEWKQWLDLMVLLIMYDYYILFSCFIMVVLLLVYFMVEDGWLLVMLDGDVVIVCNSWFMIEQPLFMFVISWWLVMVKIWWLWIPRSTGAWHSHEFVSVWLDMSHLVEYFWIQFWGSNFGIQTGHCVSFCSIWVKGNAAYSVFGVMYSSIASYRSHSISKPVGWPS